MFNLIELAVWGRKSKMYKRFTSGRKHKNTKRLVLNQRAQLQLASKWNRVLPQDVAISIFNDVKRFGMEV